ncbi:MAG: hypothetical protein G8D88_13910 [gamma proteobacterium symbiont of Ctena orbiculata]
MTRTQVENYLSKKGKVLTVVEGAERIDNDGARWRVNEPGWSGGRYFNTIADIENYIDCGLL